MKTTKTRLPFSPICAAVAGYGMSGEVFHAPFLHVNDAFELSGIMSSGEKAAQHYPKTKIYRQFDQLLHDPLIELIVICTPHQLHEEHAIAALQAGKHVVVEKPVAMSSASFLRMMEAAKNSGKLLIPYHNRRWDGDFLTVKQLMEEGFLGEIVEFVSRFDRYAPTISRAEWRYADPNGGGTLFDLGPHLIDQALVLFGKPHSVWCKLYEQRPESKVNDSFELKLFYPECTATLRAGIFVRETGPRFQVHGTLGSYLKYGLDSQEAHLKKGKKPNASGFGNEPKKQAGILHSMSQNRQQRIKYPSLSGHYMQFYEGVAQAIRQQLTVPVDPADALLGLQLIEAAVKSHHSETIVHL
jgi:scyllo-inositol 2-dehydrogenase (NADP+)